MRSLFVIVYLAVPFLAIEGHIFSQERGPPVEEPSSRCTKAPELHEIIQKVDHFNPTDLRTWPMRYMSNDEFFQKGGPIFIYLGGEWTINETTLMSGQIFDMAEQHNGYMFYTEHRYYGFSYPTKDTSTENLKYLSKDQALADIVYFVKYIKENIEGLANSKVVVVGCSYSAALATWIRLKYPHIVDAAYASSGPVKAVANFFEYLEVISNVFDLTTPECLKTISDGVLQVEDKLKSEDGFAEMTQIFDTCVEIQNTELHKNYFILVIMRTLVGGIQQYGVQEALFRCNKLLSYPGTAIEKLSALTRESNRKNGFNCTDNYERYKRQLSNITITSSRDRQWLYQTCTEFGYYHTTTSNKQPFGYSLRLEFFLQNCRNIFGKNFGAEVLNNGIIRTNLLFGAMKPKLTKVVSIHGSLDPWHTLGILEDLNPLAPAIFIPGTSHCQDTRSINMTSDSEELIAAKLRAQKLISEWIK